MRSLFFLPIFAAIIGVVASPLLAAAPPAKAPQVGIDTAFGDRFHQAWVALKQRHYQEAITKTNAALAMKPDPVNKALLLAIRGESFYWLEDNAHAYADLEEAHRLDPRLSYGRDKLGWLNYRRGNYRAAVADFTAALPRAKDPGYIYFQRAAAYKRLGQQKLAAQDFVTVTHAPAIQAEGYSERAAAFHELGDERDALRDLTTASRMDSSAPEVLNGIAWIEATSPSEALRNGKSAIRHATRACARSQWKIATFIDTLAAAYAATGDFAQAAAYEKQAIALESDPAERKTCAAHLALFAESQPVRDLPATK